MKFCVGDGFPDVPKISRNLWEGRLGSRPLQTVKERFRVLCEKGNADKGSVENKTNIDNQIN